jgi:chaperone BCS1
MDFNAIFNQVWETISKNEFFQGGALVALLGAVWFYLKSIPNRILRTLDRYCTLTITINDGNYEFVCLTKYIHNLYKDSCFGRYAKVTRGGKEYTTMSGHRWRRVGWLTWVKIVLSERELESKAGGSGDAIQYSTVLKFLGIQKRKHLSKLIAEAYKQYGPKKERRDVNLWKGSYFEYATELPERSLKTVYSHQAHAVLEDIKVFQRSRDFYKSRGIPYRKGYLFHGPPGTGKTSTCIALANELNRNLNIVNLSAVSGSGLTQALSTDNCIILFEDVDCVKASKDRDKESPDQTNKGPLGNDDFQFLSLSELLNALDGALTGENIIFFFTTNKPEVLDKALIRPGRVDKMVPMSYMSQSELEWMYESYFGEHLPEGRKVLGGLTAATAQNEFISHRDKEKFIQVTTFT